MNLRQNKLLDFVKIMHVGQTRKYTNLPYFTHLLNVAEMADRHDIALGYEVGLCHDLFEDTDCNFELLRQFLKAIGYTVAEASHICGFVDQLTDQFTSEEYPTFTRAERKNMEAHRLWGIDSVAQSVKYCDLIDNTSSIVEYDPKFAVKYLDDKLINYEILKAGHVYLSNE